MKTFISKKDDFSAKRIAVSGKCIFLKAIPGESDSVGAGEQAGIEKTQMHLLKCLLRDLGQLPEPHGIYASF